jgi:hypothetical protein
MEKAVDYYILVAEEPGILNFDIKKTLKDRGFSIMEKGCGEDLKLLIKSRTPDLTITSLKCLAKFMPPKDLNKLDRININPKGNTDTIIFDKQMNPIAFYPKPFNTNEIINFINQYLKEEITHESN